MRFYENVYLFYSWKNIPIMLKYPYYERSDFMADYVKVIKTSNDKVANGYIKRGWDLIDTYKAIGTDEYGEPMGSFPVYNLGLSSKEFTNKLLGIIKEYENHGFKEALFEKIADEQGDQSGLDSPVAKFVTNYKEIVNIRETPNSKKDKEDMPFVIGDIDF